MSVSWNSPTEDLELQRQLCRGDATALGRLLLIHHDELRAHIAIGLDRENHLGVTIEDVQQQVILQAARKVSQFSEPGINAFRAWLKVIATNLMLDLRRRSARRGEVQFPLSQEQDVSSANAVEFVAEQTAPSQAARRGERVRDLQAAVDQLEPRQADVIRRYYLLDQSLDAIAQDLSCSKETVRGLCYRGRIALRKLLGGSSRYFSN